MVIEGLHYSPKCFCKNCKEIERRNNISNYMTPLQKESEWEKKWNDGVRPCAWDEVADFITAIVSTREKEIAEEVVKLGVDSDETNKISVDGVLSILKH